MKNDEKTYGELFFLLCDDIQDMELETALKSIRTLFTEIGEVLADEIQAMIENKVKEWLCSQPAFIQALFSDKEVAG